jgi:ornithine cyclodeaminase/alanine dehydrogenase-like protein (mu-crystallin family)
MAAPIIGQELLYLSEADVQSVMPSAAAVADRIVELTAARAAGDVLIHPKAVISGRDTATFFVMPVIKSGDVAGIKWLGGAPTNPARGIPAFLGTTTLNDAETGAPVAIIGAAATTVIRTAALSLLAARRLARPTSSTLGLIGAGMQAAAHMKAMREHFPITRILVSSVGDTARTFCDRWSETGLTIEPAAPEQVLAQSDIIVSAVAADPSLVPFLDGGRLKAGAFAAMPDLGKPWTLKGLTAFAAVYTDDKASSTARGATVTQMAAVDYAGDIDELGGDAPLPVEPDARTAFLFAGTPIADFAIAMLVNEAAIAHGMGQILPL